MPRTAGVSGNVPVGKGYKKMRVVGGLPARWKNVKCLDIDCYAVFSYRNRYLFVFVTVIGNETYRAAFFLLFRLAQKLGKGLVQFVELRIGAYLQFLDAP